MKKKWVTYIDTNSTSGDKLVSALRDVVGDDVIITPLQFSSIEKMDRRIIELALDGEIGSLLRINTDEERLIRTLDLESIRFGLESININKEIAVTKERHHPERKQYIAYAKEDIDNPNVQNHINRWNETNDISTHIIYDKRYELPLELFIFAKENEFDDVLVVVSSSNVNDGIEYVTREQLCKGNLPSVLHSFT